MKKIHLRTWFWIWALTFLFKTTLFSQTDLTFYKATTDFYGHPDTVLTYKFPALKMPPSVESFKAVFHFPPLRQDTTGSCWAFSGISLLESEIFRLSGAKIKLSEMYIVYWEFVAKAREFIRTRGKSVVAHGSQEEAVFLRMREHGIVPAAAYSGLLPGQTVHNHDPLLKEMQDYLDFVKTHSYWDEQIILTQIRLILNKYLGEPPTQITVAGQSLTPQQYFEQVVRLPLNDYVSFMSFKYQPFFTRGSYRVPDNYWNSQEYYNIPLDLWYQAIIRALQQGYTVGIGGDVSEIGKAGDVGVALIPDFDIPPEKIDQDAREFRFDNQTSTDDHGVHLVGYQKYQGQDWFLIKDSGASAHKGKFKGYYFFRGDFLKLKMLTFTVHKNAVPDLLKQFGKP